MDEVGRGTTVTDGLAIAYATLHHLVNNNKCRALFATHFHELSDMLGYPDQNRKDFGSVEFFCTDIDEIDVCPLILSSNSAAKCITRMITSHTNTVFDLA